MASRNLSVMTASINTSLTVIASISAQGITPPKTLFVLIAENPPQFAKERRLEAGNVIGVMPAISTLSKISKRNQLKPVNGSGLFRIPIAFKSSRPYNKNRAKQGIKQMTAIATYIIDTGKTEYSEQELIDLLNRVAMPAPKAKQELSSKACFVKWWGIRKLSWADDVKAAEKNPEDFPVYYWAENYSTPMNKDKAYQRAVEWCKN